MNKLTSILLSISAACFIALGSGFITLLTSILDYEKESYSRFYEIQTKMKKVGDYKNLDCNENEIYKAECKIATHQVGTITSIIKMLQSLMTLLLIIGFSLPLIAILVELLQRPNKAKKTNNKSKPSFYY